MPRPSKTGVRGLSKREGDGRYVINLRWRDPATDTPRRHYEVLPSGIPFAAAKHRAQAVLAQSAIGTLRSRAELAAERERQITLRVAFDRYLEEVRVSLPASYVHRRAHASAICTILGAVKLAELSQETVQGLKKALREGDRGAKRKPKSPATTNRHLATLKHMLRRAADNGWLDPGAAARVRAVKLEKEPPGRTRHLGPEEEQRLFETVPEALRPLVVTALLSGMRQGEIRTLRRTQVNLRARTLTLTRTKNNRVRHVPINPPLEALLRAQLRSHELETLFPRADGEPYTKDQVSKAFRRIAAAAKVRDFRFHDLRHTFATRLRGEGVGIDAIQKLLGHTTLAMTMRYAHVGDRTLHAAVSRLEAPRSLPATLPAEVITLSRK